MGELTHLPQSENALEGDNLLVYRWPWLLIEATFDECRLLRMVSGYWFVVVSSHVPKYKYYLWSS